MIYEYIDPGTGFIITNLIGVIIASLLAFLSFIAIFFRRFVKFFKNNKKPLLIILIIIIIGTVTAGIIMIANKKESTFNKKIIILGFDGLSPEIVEPMMEKGDLPNLLRLKEEGSYRRLSTTNPSQSPVAWAGFATGKNPGKNGVFDFIVRDPESYALSLCLSNIVRGKPKTVIKSKTFWQYSSKKKIPTGIKFSGPNE